MNCLPLMIKVMHEIMRNSRDHVSCTQHLEVTHAFQKSKFENLTDACINIHVYVCNLEIKLKWNELLCSREIVNRRLVAKFCANFSRKRKFRFSLLSDAYKIIPSMPMFATYRLEVEWIISEVLTAVLWESRAWKLCTFQGRERFPKGTSCLHRIMYDFRSTLIVYTVEALMRISINGVVSPEHYHWLTGWK